MSRRLKDYLCTNAGSAGAQSDFLVECGVIAHLMTSEALGSKKAQRSERICAPERPRPIREHNSPENPGDSVLRSCAPEQCAEEINMIESSTEWTSLANLLIADLPDESLRLTLIDFYEETAATLEFVQGHTLTEAEQLAFGALVFQMLERGIDVRAVS